MVKIIGKGAFGQVAKANVKDIPNIKRNEPVAVKMLKGSYNKCYEEAVCY